GNRAAGGPSSPAIHRGGPVHPFCSPARTGTLSSWLGRRHAARIIGLHLNYIPRSYRPGLQPGAVLSREEQQFLADADRWEQEFGAYDHAQFRTPQTAAYGLNDSPAALAAWILE